MKLIFGMQINKEVFYKLILSIWVFVTRHVKNKRFAYLYNVSRKAWRMKFIFCLQINTKVFYKLIVSLKVCKSRHAQNSKFTISLRYLKKNVKNEADFLKVLSDWYYHSRCVWPVIPKLSRIACLLFLCNILRENWMMKLIFCMQTSMKAWYKLILWFWWGWSSIPKVSKIPSVQCFYNISKSKLEMKLIFCM